MIRTRLTEMLEAYVAGHATAAEVVSILGVRTQPMSSTRTLLELEMDRDPHGIEPGTWEEIAAAHLAHRLSDEQYEELWNARHR
jgi:hypothetical protein